VSGKSESNSVIVRKPTVVVLLISLGIAAMYVWARHDLMAACPQLLQREAPVFAPPELDSGDGSAFIPCTDIDSRYVEEQKYLHLLEIGGVLIVSLLIIDIATFLKHRDEND
jgi:hypothetical protein